MRQGLVSIILLNWNGKEFIFDCLKSLFAQDYKDFEIIVVDNNSEDGSLEMIQEQYRDQVLIAKNATNYGFAGGCNVGIRVSSGEYIALINSDAVAEKNWLSEMVKTIEEDKKVGMVAGKIYMMGEDKILENTGHVVYRDALARGRGRLEKDTGQYDDNNRIFCPNGCAALYRRKMLEEIDLFDELFFAYADDIDIGFRGRLLGYECAYTPKAIAHHHLSGSFGMLSDLKAFLIERNRLWVLIKCFPIRHLLMSPFYTFIRYLYTFMGMLAKKGPAARYAEKMSSANLAWVAVKVYLSTIWHLPYLLYQRFRTRGQTRTSAKEFESWMKLYGISAKEVSLHEISKK